MHKLHKRTKTPHHWIFSGDRESLLNANSFITYIVTTDIGIDIIAKAAGHPDRDTDILLLFANSDIPYVKLSS